VALPTLASERGRRLKRRRESGSHWSCRINAARSGFGAFLFFITPTKEPKSTGYMELIILLLVMTNVILCYIYNLWGLYILICGVVGVHMTPQA